MDTPNNSYVIENETLSYGNYKTLSIQLDTTITYSINVTDGSYPNEITWDITDSIGNQLINGVAPTNMNLLIDD